MFRSFFFAVCLGSLLFSCEKGGENASLPKGTEGQKVENNRAGGQGALIQVQDSVHPVKCGCAIPEVGKCGEFLELDGKFYPIEGDLGLGPMPFCHKEGLKAQVEGELKEGKFYFKKFHLLKQ